MQATPSAKPGNTFTTASTPNMTQLQKHLVQHSFEQVSAISDRAAALFYHRLFSLNPDLRQLFKGDMEEQGRKLMAMLAIIVKGLDRPETLLPVVAHLGERHSDYGVQEEHYVTVGAALLWTLQQGLGERFTRDVREAWTAAYGLLAATMKRSSRHAAPAMAS